SFSKSPPPPNAKLPKLASTLRQRPPPDYCHMATPPKHSCHSDRSEPLQAARAEESRQPLARIIRDSQHRASRPFLYLLSLLTLLYLPSSLAVATKELRIERFDEEVVVAPNGSVDVTENIRVHFIGSPWHGLYRTIPIEYFTPQGLNYTLFLDIQSITDGEGQKLRFESSRVRHYRKLK